MVTAEIAGGTLILRVQGMDRVWALKSELTIQLVHITNVRLDEEIVRQWWHGAKMPGTSIPGVITAGTFYQHGKRIFWDIHHPKQAVIISLAHESYDELVIEVESPEIFVVTLKDALGNLKGRL